MNFKYSWLTYFRVNIESQVLAIAPAMLCRCWQCSECVVSTPGHSSFSLLMTCRRVPTLTWTRQPHALRLWGPSHEPQCRSYPITSRRSPVASSTAGQGRCWGAGWTSRSVGSTASGAAALFSWGLDGLIRSLQSAFILTNLLVTVFEVLVTSVAETAAEFSWLVCHARPVVHVVWRSVKSVGVSDRHLGGFTICHLHTHT